LLYISVSKRGDRYRNIKYNWTQLGVANIFWWL